MLGIGNQQRFCASGVIEAGIFCALLHVCHSGDFLYASVACSWFPKRFLEHVWWDSGVRGFHYVNSSTFDSSVVGVAGLFSPFLRDLAKLQGRCVQVAFIVYEAHFARHIGWASGLSSLQGGVHYGCQIRWGSILQYIPLNYSECACAYRHL